MKKAVIVFVSIIAVMGVALVSGVAAHGSQRAKRSASAHAREGYSIVYYESGKAVFQNYGDEINEKSVFELASNGKTVSAYIALKMVDEGKLNLDDKIAPFLDDDLLTDDLRMNDITVRQLLCHTAGFSPSYELGMNNSTFKYAKTVTPYMNLSSAVLYMFAVFAAVFMILLPIGLAVGKITKCRIFSGKIIFVVCFVTAGIINMLFLLLIFVSKVAAGFGICFAWMALLLLLTRKSRKLFYAVVPVVTAFIMILGFTIPVSIPVTNDVVAKEPNCAYTFKSTGEDMSVFCQELMRQYHSSDGAIKDMFSNAVTIDKLNEWGLGLAIEAEGQGKTYWHSGINPGFQSLFVLYPSQDKYVVVLTNSDKGLSFAKEAAGAFLEVDGRWEIQR